MLFICWNAGMLADDMKGSLFEGFRAGPYIRNIRNIKNIRNILLYTFMGLVTSSVPKFSLGRTL